MNTLGVRKHFLGCILIVSCMMGLFSESKWCGLCIPALIETTSNERALFTNRFQWHTRCKRLSPVFGMNEEKRILVKRRNTCQNMQKKKTTFKRYFKNLFKLIPIVCVSVLTTYSVYCIRSLILWNLYNLVHSYPELHYESLRTSTKITKGRPGSLKQWTGCMT